MTIILILAVSYCVSMTVATACFVFNSAAFTGGKSYTTSCYIEDDAYKPSISGGNDTSDQMSQMVLFGFIVHLAGVVCDSLMLYKHIKPVGKLLDRLVVVLTGVYTCAFVVWLVMMHVVRYGHKGRVCSGSYLTGD